ncbi:hypothetical protein Tsubulata_011724 [Turnera subulata]|uniref:DUF4283 domain-containing protein n=1 Tax=Turnera subulata TaxID=218843 RepID=A0A9Q0JQ34_9ROSI|nr:hypothetical protein Tsubulata_011724 [Turnera subulata]
MEQCVQEVDGVGRGQVLPHGRPTEEDEDVLVLEDSVELHQGPQFYYILVKVLGLKDVNPQAFVDVMRKEVLDADKPWFFEKQLVVIKAISGDEVLSQVDLVETPIWVQMYDIPLNQRTSQNVQGIAIKVGCFLRFDEKGAAEWGKFVQVRVALNIDKPLRKNLLICKGSGSTSEVTIHYEGIPNFCYLYGKLSHLLKECEQRQEDSDEEEVVHNGSCKVKVGGKPLKHRNGRKTAGATSDLSPCALDAPSDSLVEDGSSQISFGDNQEQVGESGEL